MAIELTAGPDDNERRLDRVLRKALSDYSLSLIHRLLRQGKVLVNGKVATPSERVKSGQVIHIKSLVNIKQNMVNDNTDPPAALPQILFQRSGIIVFNKPPGLATHGPHGLSSLVIANLANTLPYSLSFKPGPLHRLDKPTSGAIVFSTTLDGARLFSRLLREHRLIKTYLAVVEGRITAGHTWEDELVRDTRIKKTYVTGTKGRENAITKVKPLSSNGKYTLLEAQIITGRTHQIRAQAAAHGHPMAGDRKYGGHGPNKLYLHAWKIEIDENSMDIPDDFPRLIVAPPPESFRFQTDSLFNIRH